MRVSTTALALFLTAVLGTVQAAEAKIATWTDSAGITHFGDAQFAPASATEVDVAPANGMAAPSPVSTGSRSSGPAWTVIDQAPKQNKVGWRSKGEGTRPGPITPSQR